MKTSGSKGSIPWGLVWNSYSPQDERSQKEISQQRCSDRDNEKQPCLLMDLEVTEQENRKPGDESEGCDNLRKQFLLHGASEDLFESSTL